MNSSFTIINCQYSVSVRMLNDKLMLLERIFLLPQGLPDRQNFRNAIFSPSKLNSYGKIHF